MRAAPSFLNALRALEEFKRLGIVEDYAIAGAMALVFWTEPIPTYDLGVLVFLAEQEMGHRSRPTTELMSRLRQGRPSCAPEAAHRGAWPPIGDETLVASSSRLPFAWKGFAFALVQITNQPPTPR
jgi:hypothetical protein